MSFVPGSTFVRRYAFAFQIPDRLKLDDVALAERCRAHFDKLELNESVILEFSRYTRTLAGRFTFIHQTKKKHAGPDAMEQAMTWTRKLTMLPRRSACD